ncbi:MAG TPA: sulfatase [Chloroflexi bacterium]|nr:sulfatase [Chloroflexota bacterium]
MRILLIDIDTLRPDHMGCYGYHRNTSPNIDSIAARGVCFNNTYITDAPCLPSRSALWSGRTGFHTGVVGHGGTAADPHVEGNFRGFRDRYSESSLTSALRKAGYYTTTVSTFGERHAAWWWYAGWNEVINCGGGGVEIADDVTPHALSWLDEHAEEDNWFLHVNYWDPHTPYRTPEGFGNPFEDEPLDPWYTEELRKRCFDGFGPHSAQELHNYPTPDMFTWINKYPRINMPSLSSMAEVKRWIDGYDVGIRYADMHVGYLLDKLHEKGIVDDVAIIVTSDHGENQGELNVWGDHQSADDITCRVPLIVSWPGVVDEPRVDKALHQHFDWAATVLELAGGSVPEKWDGCSFAKEMKEQQEAGRDYVVTSQAAWACQRGVRFDHDGKAYICLRTYHDGHKDFDDVMLYCLTDDPHEEHNLAKEKPALVQQAMAYLADWHHEQMVTADSDVDPMVTVLCEGGPYHTRGMLKNYIKVLEDTGRAEHAETLKKRHPDELSEDYPYYQNHKG